MFSSGKHSRSPIGLDLGTRRIKAVQLDKSGTRVMAAAVIPRTEHSPIPAPAEVARLAATLDRGGFVGNQVVLAVPSDKLIVDVLEFPKIAGSYEQLARMEIARGHRCPPDGMEVGVWELPAAGRAAKSTKLMVVACRHEDTAPVLDVFEGQRMDIVALDARSCVLARAAAPLLGDEKAVTAILDFGWNAATLVLVYQRTVFYERKILEAGMGRLHRELCQRLRIEPDIADYVLEHVGLEQSADNAAPPEAYNLILSHMETLTSELAASFNYAGHQYEDAPPGRLLLAGGGSAVPGVAAYLAKHAGVSVRSLAPADLYPCPPARSQVCRSPALLPAVGLAMYGLEKTPEKESSPRAA